MLNLSTHQLQVFLAAAESLNFTHAAHLLQVTQPSVSQHIQALEEHFGLPLFLRTGRNIALTDAGMALIPLAREMVFLSTHIEETMSSLGGDVHGHMILDCSTAFGRYFLPKLLAAFHCQCPHVRSTCLVNSQPDALKMLSDGKVHIVMVSDPPFYQDVEFRKFTREEVVLIAPLDHPWAKRKQIELEELFQENFILPEEGSEIHTALREKLEKLNFSVNQLKTLISLGSLEAIAFSVQEGIGVGFVPKLLVTRLVREKVTPVKIDGLMIGLDIYVARNARRPTTAAQEAFWDLINSSEFKHFETTDTQQLIGA